MSDELKLKRKFEYSDGSSGITTFEAGLAYEDMPPEAAELARKQGAFGEQAEIAKPYYSDAALTDIGHVQQKINNPDDESELPTNQLHGAAITGPVDNNDYPTPRISSDDNKEPLQPALPGVAQNTQFDTRTPATPSGVVSPNDADPERAETYGKPGYRQNEQSVTSTMEPAFAVKDINTADEDKNPAAKQVPDNSQPSGVEGNVDGGKAATGDDKVEEKADEPKVDTAPVNKTSELNPLVSNDPLLSPAPAAASDVSKPTTAPELSPAPKTTTKPASTVKIK